MPAIKYKVNLTDEEKLKLEALLRKGKSAARCQTRADIVKGGVRLSGPSDY